MTQKKRILITGAAGLVGQNLMVRLKDNENAEIIAIDKHPENSTIFRKLHPEIQFIEANLAHEGDWAEAFVDIDVVVMNHAQIGAVDKRPFLENNINASRNILDAMKQHNVPYLVHISSSVVKSEADDFYIWSKSEQEKMVLESGINCVVLRPTLMFGWFDRKHLGWLARFMRKAPVFPIPNFGKYIRQPLYAGDFANVIISAIFKPKIGEIHDISGREKICYVDIIKMVRKSSGARAMILYIPYHLFWVLLKVYAVIDRNPPFTTNQLEALVIPEEFAVTDWPTLFGVEATSVEDALKATFGDPEYSKIVLEF
ncbi:MAG: NAD-dependent epimerase/dehydratase family protein [Lentilitoribacter sp.]